MYNEETMGQDVRSPEEQPEHRARYEIRPTPPASELLLDVDHLREVWPLEIAENKMFLEQIGARRMLIRQLEETINALPRPDVALEDAVIDGQLTQDQVDRMYESLEGLLGEDSEYQRILLYLPFEFLPGAPERFKEAYMASWERQLSTHDVRANFVDGDVMEVDKRDGDLPRVVKAAHLIPKLVEAGFMTVEEVARRMNETDDEILRQSIADTLPVLQDMGFLEGGARIEKVKEVGEVNGTFIDGRLNADFARIDTASYGDVAKKREEWLKKDNKRKAVELASELIQKAIEQDTLGEFDLAHMSPPTKQAFIDGVRMAVESVARGDESGAKKLLAVHEAALESLWQTDGALHDVLAKTYFRLYGLGLMTQESLAAHELSLPALEGPFSKNLERMKDEMKEVKRIVEVLERDKELAKFVFPVVLVYGSRLKGYGSPQSDVDVAVFVKPDVEESDKAQMRMLLKKVFGHEKIDGEVAEFWTRKRGAELEIIDREEYDPAVGESYWTHVLFGAVWEGKPQAVAELRAKILPAYFCDDGNRVHGREARGLGLEELERDTLQYRLMHRGYEQFYPPFGGINTPHADSIDGQSTFWDSGYRQLATKLYASRVFLPKLERPE